MTKQRKTLRNDNIVEQKEKKQKVHPQSLCFNYVLDQKRIKKKYLYRQCLPVFISNVQYVTSDVRGLSIQEKQKKTKRSSLSNNDDLIKSYIDVTQADIQIY